MESRIKGKIIASTIADFGDTGIKYGYIGVEIEKGKHIRIKIDSYTDFETLEMGDEVEIETARLGNTDILTAREITKLVPSSKVVGSEGTVAAASS